MKVVISKSGLYVRDPKNINLSRTNQDMKKSKLGFCRMSSGLSCHVKSLVNTILVTIFVTNISRPFNRWMDLLGVLAICLFVLVWMRVLETSKSHFAHDVRFVIFIFFEVLITYDLLPEFSK